MMKNGGANIALEVNVKITDSQVDAFGEDFEKTTKGSIGFLLLDDSRGFPIAVLEAKSDDKNPLTDKEQARKYAKSQNVRFIILSNGNLHCFWDLEQGNPRIITSFPTLESLRHVKTFQPNHQILADEAVGEDYIVLTQNPSYANLNGKGKQNQYPPAQPGLISPKRALLMYPSKKPDKTVMRGIHSYLLARCFCGLRLIAPKRALKVSAQQI